MARRAYFAFHYQKDIWRVNVVRNSWVTRDRVAAGFYDASLWEEAKKKGDLAIKRMILSGLDNTTVTVVLIGALTSKRRWVEYEIEKSLERGNGLLGIYIHNIKNQTGKISFKGANPFDNFCNADNPKDKLSRIVPVYDWRLNDGYVNIGDWIENSAQEMGL